MPLATRVILSPVIGGLTLCVAQRSWYIRTVSFLVSLPGYFPQSCHHGTCHISVFCASVHRLLHPSAVQEVSRDVICHLGWAQRDCGQIGEAVYGFSTAASAS